MSTPNDPKSTDVDPDDAARAHAHEFQKGDFDEVVVVPKGQSKLRFYVLLALTILVLLIFTVGSELQQSFSRRGGQGDTHMVWNDPVLGEQRVSDMEFRDETVRLEDFFSVLGAGRNSKLASADKVAELLVLDRLAEDAGIEVTAADLRDAILKGAPGMSRGFMSADMYKATLASAGVTASSFEQTFRRMLRVERYQEMVRAATGVADPTAIEKLWRDMHQEYAFDYAEIVVGDLSAEVEKKLPDDGALDDWYQHLPDRLQVFHDAVVPEKRTAEVAGFRASGEDQAAGLLAKFPPKADRDVESEAKAYYDGVHDRRFRRPTPLDNEPDAQKRLYLPYDEVKDVCKREAPVYNAMREWLADLDQRAKANTPIDLQKEATDFGLFYQTDEALRSREEWTKIGGLYGAFLTDAIFRAGTQTNLTNEVVSEAGGFALARVKQRAAQSLPPLAALKDKVLEEWKKSTAQTLAQSKLDELYKTLPVPADAPDKDAKAKNPKAPKIPKVDADAFAKALEGAGLKLAKRDFAERTPPRGVDPKSKTPEQNYFENAYALYSLEDGQVAKPELDSKKERAFLVRFAGKRDPAEVKIEPNEYEYLKMAAEGRSAQEFGEANLTAKAFVTRYGLKVRGATGLPQP